MVATAKKLSKAQQFIKDMIRHRGIEFAQIGMMVEVDGAIGTIQGMNDSANLDVVFTNKLKYGKHAHNCHPTWRVKYFDSDGKLIAHHDGDRWLIRPEQKAAAV